MTSISSSDAFLIFGKWRDNKSHLQIVVRKPGKTASTPGAIVETSPKEESIAAFIVANEHAALWRASFHAASFQYGEPLDTATFPEFAELAWASYLLVELPDGNSILFAERLAEE